MSKKYKDSEVCHDLLRAVLEIDTGISRTEEIETTVEDVVGSFWVRDGKYDYKVSKSLAKGGVPCLRTVGPPHTQEVYLIDRPWDKVYQVRQKTLDEFGVEITVEKKAYRQSEGGGWSSLTDIYNYNGKKYYWI